MGKRPDSIWTQLEHCPQGTSSASQLAATHPWQNAHVSLCWLFRSGECRLSIIEATSLTRLRSIIGGMVLWDLWAGSSNFDQQPNQNYLVGCCFSYKNNKVTVPNISGSPYKVLIKMMSEFKTHVSVSFDYLNPSKENYLESFFLKNRLRTVF